MSRAAKKFPSRKRVIDDDTGEPADVPLSVPDASETRSLLIARNIKAITEREKHARRFVAKNKAQISARLCDLDLWRDFRVQICLCPKSIADEVCKELRNEYPTYHFMISGDLVEDFERTRENFILEAYA